jgi:sugar phosphate isomerase/epimerase
MTGGIGVQLYALKDPWARDRQATMSRIAELGIAGVEAFSMGDVLTPRDERIRNAREIRALATAAGIDVISAHTTLPPVEDAGWMLEEMAELGAPVAIASTTERVLGFTRDALADSDRIARFADRLNGLAAAGRAQGLRIGYHNHYWEWVDVGGRPAYDRLVELLDPEIVLEIDLFWAYSAGRDLRRVILDNAERVEFLHVKDGDGVLGAPQVPAGTGEVPLAGALEAAGASTWQVVELDLIDPAADIWDVVADSVAWLRSRP